MLMTIKVLRDVADDHPPPLAHPFEGRIPHGTDDDQPRQGYAGLSRCDRHKRRHPYRRVARLSLAGTQAPAGRPLDSPAR